MFQILLALVVFLTSCIQGEVGSTSSAALDAQIEKLTLVPPQAAVAAGKPLQFNVIATLTDKSEVDVTERVEWSADDPVKLSESAQSINARRSGELLSASDLVRFSEETKGLLTGVTEGSAVVKASLLGKSAEARLIIGKPEISSITVSIVDEKLRVLLRQQFSAEATYTAGSKETITELALWSSSNPSVIAVSSEEADRGVTTILKAGEAEISARFGEVVGSIKVQVPDIALTELRISPENPFACASKSTPLSVFGRYADGVELDMTSAVSFSVADSAVASVSVDAGSKGVATATTTGQTTITASLSTGLGDLSDSVTFLGVDGLALVAPVGGEVLYSGVPSKVQWASCGEAVAGSIEVSVSTNSGNSYVLLGSIDEAAAEYSWTPSSNTESARVKVSRVGTQDSDESGADFSVRSPFLTVTSPETSATWAWGSSQTLSWQSGGVTGNVLVELSRDNGSTWTSLATVANSGSYVLESVPAPATVQAKVRVSSIGAPSLADTNDGAITITVPTLTVTAPNGSEVFDVGASSNITWSAPGMPSTAALKIELSKDGGTSWQVVAASVLNSGSYAYVPLSGHASVDARIRITAVNEQTITDSSDASFAIIAQPISVTAPNGAEVLYQDTATAVTWTADGTVSGQATVSYSTDGINWSVLSSTVDVQAETYSWTPTSGQLSESGRVRVSLNSFPAIKDISDAVFSVRAPSLVLSSPDGGESWEYGSTHSITWAKNGYSENTKVEYSGNNGSSWTTLAASATGTSYSWTISQPVSSQALIRLTAVTTTSLTDTSAATFSITAPNLAVTAPNGGETLYIGASSNITWSTASLPGTVDISYTIDGTNFTTIASGEANDGSYAWTIPNDPWISVKVRVLLSAENSVYDLSNANFTIKAPTISLTAPNGGESWGYSSTQSITWTKDGVSENIKVEFSGDNGSTWSTLSANTSGNSYSWTISQAVTAQALIKISAVTTTSITDTSAAVFSISQPSLEVTAPNGGETLYVGASSNITWSTASLPGTVDISYTKDGTNFTTIANGEANDGSYAWTIPSDPSATVKVRIRLSAENSVFDLSNANFSIVAPFVQVTAPNGGETWAFASSQNITWTHGGMTGNVGIEISTDAGSTWTSVATGIALSAGTYSYSVTAAATSQARVRITSESNGSVSDTSDANFTISGMPTTTVTAANGGETWYTGASNSVTWTVSGSLSGNVSILLSKDGGSTYATTLTTGVAASAGTYSWTPTGSDTTVQGRIRVISETYAVVKDESNANFTVANPFITLTAPNGGETWAAGTSQNVTWTSGGISGNIKIELSTNSGSTYGTTVAASVTNNGSYSWTIPAVSSSAASIKVSSVSTSSINDESDADFTLVDGSSYVIRGNLSGNSTKSSIDGVAQNSMCTDGLCTGSSDAYSIPNGVTIGALELKNGAYVVLPASSTATIRNVSVDNSSTLVLNSTGTFDSLTVTSGTVTSTAYSGTWNGTVWSSAPGPGNGRVHLNVSGAITVGASGTISANALGYPSATAGIGYSYNGRPGSGGGQLYEGYCYYGADGKGGTYATAGGGSSLSAFGAADFFATDKLYMGSGGGGGYGDNCDGGSGTYIGGRGAGSIYIVAASISNAGTISANGQAAPQIRSGGGSGGSVVIDVSGELSNSGSLQSLGGAGQTTGGAGGYGRIYLDAGSVSMPSGTINPMPDGSVLADIGLAAIDSVTITSTSVAVDKDGTIFSFGVPTTGNNILYQWVGQTLPSLTVNSGTVTISQAVGITSISVAGGTLQISSAIAVDALTLSSGSLTISNNFSSAPDYTQSGGTAYFNAALDLDSLSLTSGTITSAAYSGTFSVGVWTPTPGPGKGWVQISVAGALSIGASGNITVEAFGYPSATGTNGYSFDGQPGSGGGQQYSTACYYGADGYGGTYGTTGGGSSKTPFGAADFYNLAKLYMGSGGGGGHEDTCDGGSYYYNGGRGGGSIYITAASMNNAGTISANGQAAPQARSGGGSGGSVVLIVSGAVSNTGTIRSLGGAGNTSGGAGGKGRIRLTGGSFGTMTGTVDPAAE